MQLLTRKEQMRSNPIDNYSNFNGYDSEYKDWLAFLAKTRGSDCLEQSNFDKALEWLSGEGDNVRVERFRHWAVGWIEQIYVRPNTVEAEMAVKLSCELEDYPILDEEDFSRREQESAEETWLECYDERSRLKYMREHRSQFKCQSFKELRDNARGLIFSGYASELLG